MTRSPSSSPPAPISAILFTSQATESAGWPSTAAPDPVLAAPESLFARKYTGGDFAPDGRHAWLRLTPDKLVSWDFRKLAGLSR